MLIGEQRVKTHNEAAEYLVVHPNTVSRWLERYRQQGLEKLLEIDLGGTPAGQRSLSPPAVAALRERLAQPQGFGSYAEMGQWLDRQWGETVAYSTRRGLVTHQLKAKLKRPRSVPPKQN